MQYLNARYFDPELGIFIQPDWFEVTEAGVGTNRYGYSGNDPVNLRDPGGNSWLDRTWDAVFGKDSFNNTFGDKGSAWSDRTFGNHTDQLGAASYDQLAGDSSKSVQDLVGMSYSELKSQALQSASGSAGNSYVDYDIATLGAGTLLW